MRRAVLFVPPLICLLAGCTGEDATGLVPAPIGGGSAAATGASPAGGESSPAARLARAPAATAASGTARTTIVATVAGLPGRAEPLTFRGEGVIDFAAGRSRSTLDLAGALDGATADDVKLETVVADGLVYVRAPALSSLLNASAPWVRIDPAATRSDTAAASASAFGPLTDLAGSAVGAPIALLAGADPSSVRESARGEEHDEATTTLGATVDVPAASQPGGDPDDLVALEAFLERLGARRLEVEVELDEDDRLRRLVYEHAVPTPAGPAHQRFEVTYFDFGAAVEIDVPPLDQVRDLTESDQGPR